MHAFDLLVAVFALVQLARYGRAALAFLLPAVRLSAEPGAPGPASAAGLRAGAELARLGFSPLGTVRQRGPAGALSGEAGAYASVAQASYADVEEGHPEPRVTFFTPFAGATVITVRGRRRALVNARTQAGGMPDAALEAVLAAHRVAVERFRHDHGEPLVAASLEARLEAGRRWYEGDGRREVRRAAAFPFAIAAVSGLVLLSAVNILLRSAR